MFLGELGGRHALLEAILSRLGWFCLHTLGSFGVHSAFCVARALGRIPKGSLKPSEAPSEFFLALHSFIGGTRLVYDKPPRVYLSPPAGLSLAPAGLSEAPRGFIQGPRGFI
eukprot:1745039-Pyramimonas_sp.AAC.1